MGRFGSSWSRTSQFPERETSSTLIMYKCLGIFQKKGPVIPRPALNLCQALLDTEIRLPTKRVQDALSDHGDRATRSHCKASLALTHDCLEDVSRHRPGLDDKHEHDLLPQPAGRRPADDGGPA